VSGVGLGKQATFEQNASISETVGDTYKVTINDEVYSPNRQYGQYSYRETQTDRQTDTNTIRRGQQKLI